MTIQAIRLLGDFWRYILLKIYATIDLTLQAIKLATLTSFSVMALHFFL
jgi:hypothetical protein